MSSRYLGRVIVSLVLLAVFAGAAIRAGLPWSLLLWFLAAWAAVGALSWLFDDTLKRYYRDVYGDRRRRS